MFLSSAVKLSRFEERSETLHARQVVARQWAAYHGLAAPRKPSRRGWDRHADAHPILFLGGFLAAVTVAVIGLWMLMGWLLPF